MQPSLKGGGQSINMEMGELVSKGSYQLPQTSNIDLFTLLKQLSYACDFKNFLLCSVVQDPVGSFLIVLL